MKQKISELIKSLANKDLTRNCKVKCQDRSIHVLDKNPDYEMGTDQRFFTRYPSGIEFYIKEAIGHPVYIGDALEAIYKQDDDCGGMENKSEAEDLIEIWKDCGFTKSLQELFEEAEWDYPSCIDSECKCGKFPSRNDECEYKAVPKRKEVKQLFEFLLSINLTHGKPKTS